MGIVVVDDGEEHDSELADFGGAASAAVVAVSVAMHVASMALLHRSARRLKDRELVRRAAETIACRLGRRGDAPLGRAFRRALPDLGTPAFDAVLRLGAKRAARGVRAVPPSQLAALVGSTGAAELLERGARACLAGGALGAADVAALAAHLAEGAELAVGLGRGGVFASTAVDHETIEIDVDHLPDPRRPATLTPRALRRRSADETGGAVTLVFRTRARAVEVRLARTGYDSAEGFVLDGVESRLLVIPSGTSLELAPLAQDEGAAALAAAGAALAVLHREIERDPLLADLVSDLYTRAGFGGSAEALRGLLDLAPLIHRHEAVAKSFVDRVPTRIMNAVSEVVEPLRHALRLAEVN